MPPPLNVTVRTRDFRRRESLHQATHTAAALLLVEIGRKQPPETDRVRVTVQMYRWNALDDDGAHGASKPIFDALVRLGWAVDDRPRWMDQRVLPVIIDRVRPARTEIEIERLPPVPAGPRKKRGGRSFERTK